MRPYLSSLFLLLLATTRLPAQATPSPCATDPSGNIADAMLHVDTRLVSQTFTLNGAAPIPLTIDQLSVKEDRVEQTVLTLEQMNAGHADTVNPEQTTTVLLLFDQINTNFQDQMVGLNELKQTLKSSPPVSPTALYTLTRNLNRVVDFTNDSQVLLAGANHILPDRPPQIQQTQERSPFDASSSRGMSSTMPSTSIAQSPGRNPQGTLSDEIRRLATLQALARLASDLQHRPGRKVVLWMSDGITFQLKPGEDSLTGPDSSMTEKYQTVLRMLSSAQVELYPLDLRGMPPSPGALLYLHGEMTQAAELTGGRAFFNSNDYRSAILSSFQLPKSTYRLTYRSTNGKYDGTFRVVNISVKAPRTQVETRAGYFASSPQDDRAKISDILSIAERRESPEMQELIVNLQPQPSPQPKAPPVLHIRARFADLAPLPSSQPGIVCYSIAAFLVGWQDGKDNPLQPVINAATIAVNPDAHPEFADLPLQLTGKPAEYTVRGGMIDLHSYKAGTATGDTRIPKP